MNRTDLEKLSKQELIDLVEQQVNQIEAQRQCIGALQDKLSQLEARLNEVERQSKRAAAPFARPANERNKKPKRPGRKGGHEGCHRERPCDEDIHHRIEVPLSHCPHCGDLLKDESQRAVEQTILEVLPAKPEAIRLITYRNRCCRCKRQVASRHPLQVSMACGAAGTHLGPRALAIAAQLSSARDLVSRCAKPAGFLSNYLGLSSQQEAYPKPWRA
jgi:transposase